MVAIAKTPLTAAQVKAKARELGANLVGIADGAALEAHPPDPADPRRPSDITALDGGRVIVLAKRLNSGVARIPGWSDRHKYYNDELALTMIEETSLNLVYWLEDQGYPAIIIPPSHVDPWRYQDDPAQHQTTILSLPHAAVEAGLGTLGLNLQLLTPEYGPRVILTAVLCSLEVECDVPMTRALCQGPACDTHRSPYGFAKLAKHVIDIIEEPELARKKDMLRSETQFNLWQSILRGSGVVTGCRRCADVCPVGADYESMLKDAVDHIPEATPEKAARLAGIAAAEQTGDDGAYAKQRRWIGAKP